MKNTIFNMLQRSRDLICKDSISPNKNKVGLLKNNRFYCLFNIILFILLVGTSSLLLANFNTWKEFVTLCISTVILSFVFYYIDYGTSFKYSKNIFIRFLQKFVLFNICLFFIFSIFLLIYIFLKYKEIVADSDNLQSISICF